MAVYSDLEYKIEKTEREIYALVGQDVPSIFDSRRWRGKVMEWAMKDEAFKVQLFRFIDVLPCLKNDALAVRMLHEYFAHAETTPLLIRHGIGRISTSGILPHIAGKIIRKRVESLAREFISGRDPQEALPVLKALHDNGLGFSVDLLGEEVLSEDEARQYSDRYQGLITYFGREVKTWTQAPALDRDDKGPIQRLNVSLKVSSFYSQLDPADWERSIRLTVLKLDPVISAVKEFGASVTLDMEHHYLKDLTIAIFEALLERHPELSAAGIAIQAYLREARQDLSSIINRAKKSRAMPTIRLVKGAYWDYETVVNRQKGWPIPVFMKKEETDACYDELARTILENTEYVRPAFATHNIRSISYAVAVAESLRLPREALEFQMIFGMAEPVRNALKKMGFRVRIYTPIGDLIPGMAYLIRRLLENTSNESFLRQTFYEKTETKAEHKPPEIAKELTVQGNSGHRFVNEPALDFSRAENRDKMKRALLEAKKEFGRRFPLVVGGGELWIERQINSLNPARPSEVVGRVCSASRREAERAVNEARTAWSSWRNTQPEARAQYLLDAAAEMRRRHFELAALEVYEVGKSWKEADGDVTEAIDFLQFYAGEMIRLSVPGLVADYPGEENRYVYEPKGIGIVISPWNFPLAIPTGMVAAGIVTGNAVIFKPSGLSPVLGWKLVEIFRSVGLPGGVLQFLPGPGDEVGEYLVSHPGVDFVAFTGSKDVGLHIVQLAGDTPAGQHSVKRVIAEMGGKNAIIVDETADLDAAVRGVMESALGFQGQKCSACSRVIVVGDIFETFCARLKGAVESLTIGRPEDPGSFMGPVVDASALAKIRRYVDVGMTEGNPLLVRDAGEFANEGHFIGPVIIADAAPDSRIAQEEIFGPIVTVIRAKHMDQALEIAGATVYALTGGLFSRSPENIRRVINEFQVGNLYINRKITGALVGRQPFGGFAMSGVGSKAGGPDYLLQFMNARSISENTLRRGFAPAK